MFIAIPFNNTRFCGVLPNLVLSIPVFSRVLTAEYSEFSRFYIINNKLFPSKMPIPAFSICLLPSILNSSVSITIKKSCGILANKENG
jgi:hypothetical protein